MADVTIPIAALVNQGQLGYSQSCHQGGSGVLRSPGQLDGDRKDSRKLLNSMILLQCFPKYSGCGISFPEGSTQTVEVGDTEDIVCPMKFHLR
jgi:hypothetical protein